MPWLVIAVKLGGKSSFIISISRGGTHPGKVRSLVSVPSEAQPGSDPWSWGSPTGSSGITLLLPPVLGWLVTASHPKPGLYPRDAGIPKSRPASGQARCLGSSQTPLRWAQQTSPSLPPRPGLVPSAAYTPPCWLKAYLLQSSAPMFHPPGARCIPASQSKPSHAFI